MNTCFGGNTRKRNANKDGDERGGAKLCTVRDACTKYLHTGRDGFCMEFLYVYRAATYGTKIERNYDVWYLHFDSTGIPNNFV